MILAEQEKLELSAVLNLVPYLDVDCMNYQENPEKSVQKISLNEMLDKIEANNLLKNDEEHKRVFVMIKNAVDNNPSYGEIVMVNQSTTNDTDDWTDDYIQGCTFKDESGNYYVSYRGTGNGRWEDNGDGMTAENTQMQRESEKYFNKMAEKYLIDAYKNNKRVVVTGHSKGGNEAQYVYMSSKYDYIIDSCYSFDGQGFSGKAKKNFEAKHGTNYENKLNRMYSICGENDYVHDLGYPIIPEDNTYFVKTEGYGVFEFHALEYMLGDKDGNYSGLKWNKVDDIIVKGEQGMWGKLAKKLSENMMELDEENLHGASIAIMGLLEYAFKGTAMSDIKAEKTDYVDLIAHGIPVLMETLLFTQEGNEIIMETIKSLYDKYGIGGVLGASIAGTFAIALAGKTLLLTYADFALLDVIITVKDRITEKYKETKDYIMNLYDTLVSTINKINDGVKKLSAGYRYAVNNQELIIDTNKLREYGNRLRSVNQRIRNLDNRIDELYWDVGLVDLWNLMQADILISYNYKLEKCAGYLENAAIEFENNENKIINI